MLLLLVSIYYYIFLHDLTIFKLSPIGENSGNLGHISECCSYSGTNAWPPDVAQWLHCATICMESCARHILSRTGTKFGEQVGLPMTNKSELVLYCTVFYSHCNSQAQKEGSYFGFSEFCYTKGLTLPAWTVSTMQSQVSVCGWQKRNPTRAFAVVVYLPQGLACGDAFLLNKIGYLHYIRVVIFLSYQNSLAIHSQNVFIYWTILNLKSSRLLCVCNN